MRYSDLLVQKLNAVLQLSVCVSRAMQGYKTLILRLSSFLHMFHLRSSSYCKAEVLLDCCAARVWLKKMNCKESTLVPRC